jgi:hypothetical protein
MRAGDERVISPPELVSWSRDLRNFAELLNDATARDKVLQASYALEHLAKKRTES